MKKTGIFPLFCTTFVNKNDVIQEYSTKFEKFRLGSTTFRNMFVSKNKFLSYEQRNKICRNGFLNPKTNYFTSILSFSTFLKSRTEYINFNTNSCEIKLVLGELSEPMCVVAFTATTQKRVVSSQQNCTSSFVLNWNLLENTIN